MKIPVRFDEYYLVERIAVGGMAEVFKGVTYSDEGFERQMAVKRVLPHIAEDKDFIEMFIDEAKLVSQLQHPNIPQVYHLGKHEDQYFISMEFISGQDVRSLFDRGTVQSIKLDLGVCTYIVMEVCEALDYAHRKTNARQEPLHLIHRDVSPQNIIVSYDGTVKLIDFGIAKAVGQINQTQAGILKGKFSYMSPEQARGYSIDARSDLFGLGAVLYELITLERCFLGQTDFSTIERVRNTEYQLPRKIRRDIPAQLEKIVRKSLAKDPNDRFQSAADFQEALRVFVRAHQLQRSREQVATYMSSIFAQEVKNEQIRFENFQAYALNHIPEAKKSIDSNRFNESLSHQLKENHRPRFALDNEIKLSLNSHSVTPNVYIESNQITDPALASYSDSQSFFPSSSRLLLLVSLAILTGSLIAAVTWINKPLTSAIIFEDPQGLSPNYSLQGEGERFEGIAPNMVEVEKSGSYLLELSLAQQDQVSQKLELNPGQIVKVSAYGEQKINTQILYLSSQPLGARVFAEQKFIGKTPLKVYLGQKKRKLLIQAPNYQDQEIILSPSSQKQMSQNIKLRPLYRTLKLHTSIEGTEISLASLNKSKEWIPKGIQNIQINLDNLVSHRLRLRAKGYEDYILRLEPSYESLSERWIALKPLSNQSQPDVAFAAKLIIAQGQSSVKADKKVSLAKEIPVQVRSNPLPQTRKPRRIRGKRNKKRKKKLKTKKRVANNRPRKTIKPAVSADAQPGFLKLLAVPPAEAFIDGKSVGWTPLINHKLAEGRHQIKLRYQSGEEKTFVQTISAGRVSLRKVPR